MSSDFGGLEQEDILIKEFPTTQEPLMIRAEIEIDGKKLHLKDIGIFPKDSRRIEITQQDLNGILEQLKQEAKEQGFDNLRITGRRVSGSSFTPSNINYGKKIDISFDLTKE